MLKKAFKKLKFKDPIANIQGHLKVKVTKKILVKHDYFCIYKKQNCQRIKYFYNLFIL